MEYQAEQDRLAGVTDRPHRKPRSATMHLAAEETWRQKVSDFLGRDWFEILLILEGVDTTTAATVQARHSYVAEDLVWDCAFAPMFSVDPRERSAVIDFT